MIDWMRYRLLYLAISATVICAGVFSLVKWGLKIGLDFSGGTFLEYRLEKEIPKEEIGSELKKLGLEVNFIQKTEKSYLIKLSPLSQDQRDKVKSAVEKVSRGKVNELRYETVGPSVGPELIKKTLYAMLIASLGILVWVAIQFRSFKFGVSAVAAMFHDSLVVIGMYSLFGHFWSAEVDLLFVTALLTILSFSVHDTIIVFDRLREQRRRIGEHAGASPIESVNQAVSETMVRSLNNTFVVVFMMVALLLMGGSTIKWFVAALLVGTISGAYSSPFVAVPILVTWDEIEKGKWSKR